MTHPSFGERSDQTQTLYRPVGGREMALIKETGFKVFPPRLPEQPIFYPVLNIEYAIQIARDWNTKSASGGFIGYVTRFQVCRRFLANYDVQTVGGSLHKEYWIPAEDLERFNANIVGSIEVVAKFEGP